MLKKIIGGVIVLVIGGTTFAINQTDVVNNFADNTGLSQEQAEQYINNIPEEELDTFSNAGQSFIDDGNSIQSTVSIIDCINYEYEWETPVLSCTEGKKQLNTIAIDEIKLGRCYQALDTDLGNAARSKISECISDIDKVNSDFDLPIVSALMDRQQIDKQKKTNIYTKSILQAALQAN